MTQAPAAVFKIPTESPQPSRGAVSRARKAAAAKPKPASRVAGIETRAATRVATAQLNARARPWIWGRPQPKPRTYRRRFVYTL
jgi:hypothetical protein